MFVYKQCLELLFTGIWKDGLQSGVTAIPEEDWG